MPHIQVLPPYVADLIAAGEVVERPASVVKELCENALDAGATTVTVEISGGGVRSLRVTDNGCGIAREEVKTAFLPHATSKIGTAEDLDHIGTMGFRGEALPSIAAVARVQLLTRTADADVGTCCEIHCGKEVTLADAGCPVGTTVVVRDLFCRTPARMKFLKKDATEGGYVGAVLERIALSRPEVAFAFIREGKRVFQTPGDGSAGSAVRAVLGKAFYDGMLGTKNAHNGIEVTGFVCQPEAARPNRSQQYFFLNGRWIKCPTASAALGEAYKRSIMAGKFPACVLYITVPTGLVDVNVHPAKTEVRFADERPVFSAVYQSAYGALHTESKRERDALPVRAPVFASAPAAPLSSDPLSPASQMPACQLAILLRDTADGNPLIEEEAPQLLRKTIPQAAQTPVRRPTEAMPEETPPRDVRVVGEVFRTYILCERGGELLLIDKHAAHERMSFEQLKAGQSEKPAARQMLLEPLALHLSREETAALLENTVLLEDAGFVLEEFGAGTLLLRECPMLLTGADLNAQLSEIAGYLLQKRQDIATEALDWILHSAACRAAVKAGDPISAYEREKFVETLLRMPEIRHCPHGRPVMMILTKKEVEKRFGRAG